MISGILTAIVFWCMLYARIPAVFLILFCAGFGLFIVITGRRHTHLLTIDVLAQSSKLNGVNAGLKFWTVFILMGICISSSNLIIGMYLTVLMFIITVYIGGVGANGYVRLLPLPLTFIAFSALPILFELSWQPSGIINIPVLNVWLCIYKHTQIKAGLVLFRSLGAVSCLYFLSLSTPMSEIIHVLQSIRLPKVFINLMYLIYRYIFIIFSMYYTMKDAAGSRLGYGRYLTSIRTTGNLYANLLAFSYRKANMNYDAMLSRCFEDEIRFLENNSCVRFIHLACAIGIVLWTFIMRLYLG